MTWGRVGLGGEGQREDEWRISVMLSSIKKQNIMQYKGSQMKDNIFCLHFFKCPEKENLQRQKPY